MVSSALSGEIPIPEEKLRDLSKCIVGILPNFAEQEPNIGVK
jgi:hypothetical protein